MAKRKSNKQTNDRRKNQMAELPSFIPASISSDFSTSKKWHDLAEKTQQVRSGINPSELNKELASAAKDTHSPTTPLFHFWAADNLAIQGSYSDAVRAFDTVLKSSSKAEKFHSNIDIVRSALHQQAAIAALGGQNDLAIRLWKNQLSMKDKNEESMLAAGRFAEYAGRLKDATLFYESINDSKPLSSKTTYAEFAKRALLRMNGKNEIYFSNPAQLKDVLIKALDRKDIKSLRQLLSISHFSVGCGGSHYNFENDEFREQILTDLAKSSGKGMRAMTGEGEKRYLFMDGWDGKILRGDVGFLLTRSPQGWQWSGIVITYPTEALLKRWEPKVKQKNQPLPFTLKAPWPAGTWFTAGGLSVYILQQAQILAAFAIPWPAGPIIAAGLTEYYASSDCGFGPRGFYYNGGSTHDAADAFAIDFTRYRKYIPYDNESGGTLVLSPARGIVVAASGTRLSGDSSMTNYVEIMHDDPETNIQRFLSRYLHLSGPNLLSVSIGMPVMTGQKLGLMNDTGNSLLDHLHFSIHDQNLPFGDGSRSESGRLLGASIRPTPLNGVELGDGASGKCVLSTNRLYTPPPPDDAEFVSWQAPPSPISPLQRVSVSVTMRNTGPTTWIPSYKLVGVSGWNIDETPIGRTVAPNEEIRIEFTVFAFSVGDYGYRWQMARPYTGRFGEPTPFRTIRVGNADEAITCADIEREIDDAENEKRSLQDMLEEFPGNKAAILDLIRNVMARIRAMELQKQRLGCP